MKLIGNIKVSTVGKMALLLIPYFGLFGVHVLGFSSYSEYRILLLFDSSTYGNLLTNFSLYVISAFSFARILWYVIRGNLTRSLVIYGTKSSIFNLKQKTLRRISVSISRYNTINYLVVFLISCIIFSKMYLGSIFLGILLLFIIPVIVYMMYWTSESALLIASKLIRGKQEREFRFSWKLGTILSNTPDESSVEPLVDARVHRNINRLLLLILMIGTYASYSTGYIREKYLRNNPAFRNAKNIEFAIIAKTSNEFIIWNAMEKNYQLVPRDSGITLLTKLSDE